MLCRRWTSLLLIPTSLAVLWLLCCDSTSLGRFIFCPGTVTARSLAAVTSPVDSRRAFVLDFSLSMKPQCSNPLAIPIIFLLFHISCSLRYGYIFFRAFVCIEIFFICFPPLFVGLLQHFLFSHHYCCFRVLKFQLVSPDTSSRDSIISSTAVLMIHRWQLLNLMNFDTALSVPLFCNEFWSLKDELDIRPLCWSGAVTTNMISLTLFLELVLSLIAMSCFFQFELHQWLRHCRSHK